MTCKELILDNLKKNYRKWVSSLEIEMLGRKYKYLGGTTTRRARELAESGKCYLIHKFIPVTHNGKSKLTKIAFYKHKKQ